MLAQGRPLRLVSRCEVGGGRHHLPQPAAGPERVPRVEEAPDQPPSNPAAVSRGRHVADPALPIVDRRKKRAKPIGKTDKNAKTPMKRNASPPAAIPWDWFWNSLDCRSSK